MTRKCSVFVIVFLALSSASWAAEPILGYVRDVGPEAAAAREARHKRVAECRAGPVLIVHRGMHAVATENTLEAFQAALDYGADGVELDVRRSADGVLYCFHDSWLDRMTTSFGYVEHMTYPEVLRAGLVTYGTAGPETRVPTLASVLALARQRGMLIEMDVKDAGIEGEIARLLDGADAWDHIANFSEWNTDKLRANPKFKPLRGTAYLPDGRKDLDPVEIKRFIPAPGAYVVVDDPRLMARELGRKPYDPIPMPRGLREKWMETPGSNSRAMGSPAYAKSIGVDPRSVPALIELLRTDLGERTNVDGDEAALKHRDERLYNRAWAAFQLGKLGRKSAYLVYWLENQVRNRTLSKTGYYTGLDGAMAALSLAKLGAVESVPVLVEFIQQSHPELAKLVPPDDKTHPPSWQDGLVQKYIFSALGELRCPESKRFLADYLAMSEDEASKIGYPRFEEATKALLKHDLTSAELEKLLTNAKSAVRGTAVQYCLDHVTPATDAALKSAAPWTLDLPRGVR